MASRIFALFIWAAVAASLAYWGLRWLAHPTSVPANATSVSLDGGAPGDMHRLLAGPTKAASGPAQNPTEASALSSRLKLLGVVAPRLDGDSGVALLSIDGKPPRAIRIGGVVDGEMVLQSLTQHGATIGPAGGLALVTLDLPLLPAATTGSLPPPSGVSVNNGANPSTIPGRVGMSDSAGANNGMPSPPGAPGAQGVLSAPEGGDGGPPGRMGPNGVRLNHPG